jgi:hypothetical protein
VSGDDYVPPDDQFLEDLDGLWSDAQKCMLGQHGIGMEMIRNATTGCKAARLPGLVGP